MPRIADKKQVSVVVETVTGSPDTAVLEGAAGLALEVFDVVPSPEVEFLQQDIAVEGFTKTKQAVGKEAAGIEMKCNMRGSNNGTDLPAIDPYLRSCGLRRVTMRSVAGSFATATQPEAGPLRHGELVTQATTLATGIVIKDIYEGAIVMYIYDVTGTSDNTNIWTGESTHAEFTPTAVDVAEGYGYFPISEQTRSFTVTDSHATNDFLAGTLFQGETSGARAITVDPIAAGIVATDTTIEINTIRGTFTDGETITALNAAGTDYDILLGQATLKTPTEEAYVQFPSIGQLVNEDGVAITLGGARANLQFEFVAGEPVVITISTRGTFLEAQDLTFQTGATKENRTAPRWRGAVVAVRDGEQSTQFGALGALAPCVSALSLNMNLELADRLCATAATGIQEVFASDRAPSGSIDPEASLEQDIPWLGWLRGGLVFALETTLGDTDGNRFTFSMPGLQSTSVASGNKEGILTRDVAFNLTGGNLHNATFGGNVGTQGADNDLVILYHTA